MRIHLKFFGFIILAINIFSNYSKAQQGIVIYKENQALVDASAKSYEYLWIKNMREATTYGLTSGSTLHLTKFQMQLVVIYPKLHIEDISEKSQLVSTSYALHYYKSIVKRYPSSERYLRKYIQEYERIVSHVESGGAVYQGVLLSKESYKDVKKHDNDIANKKLLEEQSKNQKVIIRQTRTRIESQRRKQ